MVDPDGGATVSFPRREHSTYETLTILWIPER